MDRWALTSPTFKSFFPCSSTLARVGLGGLTVPLAVLFEPLFKLDRSVKTLSSEPVASVDELDSLTIMGRGSS
jgi:hypothetical protein